jgi:hypothetical protein
MERERLKLAFVAGLLAFAGVEVMSFIYSVFAPLGAVAAEGTNPLFASHALFYDLHNPFAFFGVVGSNLYTFLPVTSVFFFVPLVTAPLVIGFQARDLVEGENPVFGGASIAVGYSLPAAVFAVPVLPFVGFLDIALTVVYPVVFGAVGGYLASRPSVLVPAPP